MYIYLYVYVKGVGTFCMYFFTCILYRNIIHFKSNSVIENFSLFLPPSRKPPEEKKEDTLEDSEVLKMLRSADISDDSTGLRRLSGGRKVSRGDSMDDGMSLRKNLK